MMPYNAELEKALNRQQAEENPEYEVHIGEELDGPNSARICIVWLAGKRYEGILFPK